MDNHITVPREYDYHTTNNKSFWSRSRDEGKISEIANREEDLQSDDELVFHTTTMILNDLDTFL